MVKKKKTDICVRFDSSENETEFTIEEKTNLT